MKLFSYDAEAAEEIYEEHGKVGFKHFYRKVFKNSYHRRKHNSSKVKALKEALLDFIYHYSAWKVYLKNEVKR